MAVGAVAWAMAIQPVKLVGRAVASERSDKYANKGMALVVGLGIAYSTTPLLSKLLGWKTPSEKVRGIALVSQ